MPLGELFFSALENFGSLIAVSHLRQCKNNLKAISRGLSDFAGEHSGAVPASIKELVPKFLDEFPSCPAANKDTYVFSSDGQEITVACSGHWHKSAGVKHPDYPRISPVKGLESDALVQDDAPPLS